MKKHLSKKRVVLAAIIAVALAISSGVAYAYFTSSGNGTGSAGVGSATGIDLVGTATGVVTPDGDTASVDVVVTNNGTGSQRVGTVQLESVTTPAGCDASAFSMANIPVNQTLIAGGTTSVNGILVMHNNGSNQDLCQGASLTLNLSSN